MDLCDPQLSIHSFNFLTFIQSVDRTFMLPPERERSEVRHVVLATEPPLLAEAGASEADGDTWSSGNAGGDHAHSAASSPAFRHRRSAPPRSRFAPPSRAAYTTRHE